MLGDLKLSSKARFGHITSPPLEATTALLQSIWINEKNMAEQSAELEEEAPNACAQLPNCKNVLGWLFAQGVLSESLKKKSSSNIGWIKKIVDQNPGKDAWSLGDFGGPIKTGTVSGNPPSNSAEFSPVLCPCEINTNTTRPGLTAGAETHGIPMSSTRSARWNVPAIPDVFQIFSCRRL